MSKRLTSLTVIATVLMLLMLAFNHAMNHLVAVSSPHVKVEFAQGSATKGQAFVQINSHWQPVWLSLQWHWCPSLNPLQWCVDFNGDTLQGSAKLSTNGSVLTVTDAIVSTYPIDLVFAGFVTVNATVEANIKQLSLQQGQQLDAIDAVDAIIMASDINAVGVDLKNHRLTVNKTSGSDFALSVEGEQATGAATATVAGQYQTQLSLTPPDSMAHMIRLPKNPDGSYRFEASGTLPVTR